MEEKNLILTLPANIETWRVYRETDDSYGKTGIVSCAWSRGHPRHEIGAIYKDHCLFVEAGEECLRTSAIEDAGEVGRGIYFVQTKNNRYLLKPDRAVS